MIFQLCKHPNYGGSCGIFISTWRLNNPYENFARCGKSVTKLTNNICGLLRTQRYRIHSTASKVAASEFGKLVSELFDDFNIGLRWLQTIASTICMTIHVVQFMGYGSCRSYSYTWV